MQGRNPFGQQGRFADDLSATSEHRNAPVVFSHRDRDPNGDSASCLGNRVRSHDDLGAANVHCLKQVRGYGVRFAYVRAGNNHSTSGFIGNVFRKLTENAYPVVFNPDKY